MPSILKYELGQLMSSSNQVTVYCISQLVLNQ